MLLRSTSKMLTTFPFVGTGSAAFDWDFEGFGKFIGECAESRAED